MSKEDDISGQSFSNWTALCKSPQPRKWVFQCKCGKISHLFKHHVKYGKSKSCGCLTDYSQISKTHGMRKSSEYTVWSGMKDRCLNPRSISYNNYGGRGIAVCERWLSFKNFYEDMGDRPEGMSIDRIDADGNYEPSNCRWSDAATQSANTSKSLLIEINGISKRLPFWCKENGISNRVATDRIRKGWDPVKAVSFPHRTRPKNK